jgi:hypothetical protein
MGDLFNNGKKKRVKRLSSANTSIAGASSSSHYYESAFITKPCDQLFGPQTFDFDTGTATTTEADKSVTSANTSLTNEQEIAHLATTFNSSCSGTVDKENARQLDVSNTSESSSANVMRGGEYIPAPKWNKLQNSMMEEIFKKSRYPKSNELKALAQKLHVMDTDIEEWFRRRRGKDRKIRRKNEALKNLIDNYIDK